MQRSRLLLELPALPSPNGPTFALRSRMRLGIVLLGEFLDSLHRMPRTLAHAGTAIWLSVSLFGCGSTTDSPSRGLGSGGPAADTGAGAGSSGHAGVGGGDAGGTNGDGTGGGENRGGQAGSGNLGGSSGGSGALSACPGSTQPFGKACRSQADCPNFGICVAEQPTSGAATCGACTPSTFACLTDIACGPDRFCGIQANPSPCQCMGPGTDCFPKCTADSCTTSEVCGADGRCGPKSCQDGYSCPTGTLCDPARPGDGHHCAPARCDLGEVSCGADEVCDPAISEPGSHCRPKSCGEGATCPKNQHCNPQGSCERLKCAADTDCECGACVGGVCQDHLFVCFMAPP